VPVTGYSVVIPPLNVASDADLDQANRDAVIDTRLMGEWQVSHVVAPYPIDNPRLLLLDRLDWIYIYRNLDFQADDMPDVIPNWPTSQQAIIDARGEVEFAEPFTRLFAVFSLITFAGVAVLWLSLFVRQRRGS
jgi:hypothetical protein